MMADPLGGGNTTLEKFSVYGKVNVGATVKLIVLVSLNVRWSADPFGLMVNIFKM